MTDCKDDKPPVALLLALAVIGNILVALTPSGDEHQISPPVLPLTEVTRRQLRPHFSSCHLGVVHVENTSGSRCAIFRGICRR